MVDLNKINEENAEEASFSIANNQDRNIDDNSMEDNKKLENDFSEDNKRKKVNIGRYQDPEGLTVEKMAIGLWLVRNRKHFLFILIVVLSVISVITWGRFLYVYGSYVIFGMKADNELARGIVTHTAAGHEFFKSRAPVDLEFSSLQIVKGGNDKYDFLIKVTNPNNKYWAEIESHILAGEAQTEGYKNFVLPNESKFILATGEDVERLASNAKFIIDRIGWHRIDRHIYPDWNSFSEEHLSITVDNIEFTPADKTVMTEKIPLNNLEFTAYNNTAYNYWSVDLNIIIYGARGNLLILNKHSVNSFMSAEKRTVNITVPGDFPLVGEILIVPEVNITQDDIYIKFNGGAGKEK
jgi:hypothetical protein